MIPLGNGLSVYVHMDLLSINILTAFTNVAPASPIRSWVFFMGVCRTETREQIGKVSPRSMKNKLKENHKWSKNLISKSKKHCSTPLILINHLVHDSFAMVLQMLSPYSKEFAWEISVDKMGISVSLYFQQCKHTHPPAPVMIRWWLNDKF